jgi:hypothetical protein
MLIRCGLVTLLTSVALVACTGAAEEPQGAPHGDLPVATEPHSTPSATKERPPDPVGRAPRFAELAGVWKPVTLYGRDVRGFGRIHGERPTIRFLPYWSRPGYRAYDGCNWSSGRLHLRRSGVYTVSRVGSTFRACSPTPNAALNELVIRDAVRMTLDHHRLRFLARDGEVLGTYLRVAGIGVLALDP